MKNKILFFAFTIVVSASFGQTGLTNYGTNSGTSGDYSSYFGNSAGYSATSSSDYNVFDGYKAGYSNTSGDKNVFTGYETGLNNTSGTGNTFIGYQSGNSNNNDGNSFFGFLSGISSTGHNNTFIGRQSGYNSTSGVYNTFVGTGSGQSHTIGHYNTAIGYNAGQNTGNFSNTTSVGYSSSTTASNQVRIGNSSVTSIGGFANWTNISDIRFKNQVKQDVIGLEFINQLKPISYTLNRSKIDNFLNIPDSARSEYPESKRQLGFSAQEVERIVNENGFTFSGIDIPEDKEKGHYGIRYAEFVVPLVKAVQELSSKIDEQQQIIESLQNGSFENSRKLEYDGLNSSEPEQEFKLFQNQPNPFRIDTKIRMQLPTKIQNASLIIYNLEGKQLKSIQVKERGDVTIVINGSQFVPGIYLYGLITDGTFSNTKRLVLTE